MKIFKKPLVLIFMIVLIAFIIQKVIYVISEQHNILRATLVDDIASTELVLNDKNEFKLISRTIFGERTVSGDYKILNNKIIFLNRLRDDKVMPDTVTIMDNKIILKFDSYGKPITDFATYFRIDKNLITAHTPKANR